MTAQITKGTGEKAKEFRAVLKSKGRILAHTEHYKRMATLLKMLHRNFQNFIVKMPDGWYKKLP